MPSLEQVRQFFTLTVIPIVSAALANWLIVHVHFLEAFHVTSNSVAGVIAQLGIFVVGVVLAFLASHHILKGTYKSEPPVAPTKTT